jgi:2-dehydro-3-deoxyphosphooctonate aldolase (KDO 8-P synthase)
MLARRLCSYVQLRTIHFSDTTSSPSTGASPVPMDLCARWVWRRLLRTIGKEQRCEPLPPLRIPSAYVSNKFSIGEVSVGSGTLFLIAGPCVIESEAHALRMAESTAAIARSKRLPYIFKSSYDKANRTSIHSFRGPGLTEGLRVLNRVRHDVGVPVLTDVHEAVDVPQVAEAVDVLQIPAFLCRQTDLLMAAAKSGRAINIKKGQFVSPWDMWHAVEKVRDAGGERVFLTERGASFGYNNLVVDMRSLAIMREFAPVVFDATHSVQLPSAGALNGKEGVQQTGGQPEYIPLLARAAVAAGVDGVFLEVHDNPSQAKSDGANALDLKNLPDVLDQLIAVHAALN